MSGKFSSNLMIGVAATAIAVALPAAAQPQSPAAANSRIAAAAADRVDAKPAPDESAGDERAVDEEAEENADDESADDVAAKDTTAADDTTDIDKDPGDDDADEDDTADQKPDTADQKPDGDKSGPDNAGGGKAGNDKTDGAKSGGEKSTGEKSGDDNSGENRTQVDSPPAWQRATLRNDASAPRSLAGQATFVEREDHKAGSASLTFGARLPTAVETRIGLDLDVAEAPNLRPTPPPLTPERDRGARTAWTDIALPAAALGLDDMTLRARIETGRDQSKLATTIKRKLGDGLQLTLKNSYALAGESGDAPPLAARGAANRIADRNWSSSHTVRLDLFATDTAFAATSKVSAAGDSPLHSLSAEQKIAGPLSITGTVSETDAGTADKSLKAKLSTRW